MSTQGTRSKLPKAVWHRSTVHTFCDICIRAIEKMFRPHTHFNKQGWDYIINEFRKQTALDYGQKQLKNKWDSLKKEYKLWRDLIRNETGLGWDTSKNTIGADDAWWDEKIKVNPSFGNFRISGIEPQLEEKLELMFSTIIATGEFAISPGCNVNISPGCNVNISPGCNVNITPQEDQADVEGYNSAEGIPFEQSLDEMFETGIGGTQPSIASNRSKRNVEVGGSDKSSIPFKKGKRQSGGAAMLARHIETLVGAVASRSSTGTSRVTEPEVPSLKEIVVDLITIPGFDINGDKFMFATEFLEDKQKREVYTTLQSPAHKLNWLTYHFIHKGPNKNM